MEGRGHFRLALGRPPGSRPAFPPSNDNTPPHSYGDENFAPPFPHTQKRMASAPNPLKSVGEGLGEVSASLDRPVDRK